MLFAACSRSAKTATIDDGLPGEKRWPLHGQIVSVDAVHQTLRVQHEEIVGLMPAMMMDYAVGPGDLANAKAGEHIRADLVQNGGDFRLERIFPDDASTNATIEAAAKSLGQDTMVRGPHPFRRSRRSACRAGAPPRR